MPIVAIGEVGVPSISSGHSAVDTFLNDRIDAVQQRTCQGCAFACECFWCRTVFKLLTPDFTKATKKSVLGEK